MFVFRSQEYEPRELTMVRKLYPCSAAKRAFFLSLNVCRCACRRWHCLARRRVWQLERITP